jgi:hypothetical protein
MLTDLIPAPWRLLGELAIAAAALIGAFAAGHHGGVKAEHIKTVELQARWDRANAISAAAAASASSRNETITETRVETQAENLAHAEPIIPRLAAAVAASAAGDGLRIRATVAAGCRAAAVDPAASAASAAAGAEPDGPVLSDVLGSLVAAGRQIALEADRRKVRGALCAADYDALTPAAPASAGVP